jgi:hypothetical protein
MTLLYKARDSETSYPLHVLVGRLAIYTHYVLPKAARVREIELEWYAIRGLYHIAPYRRQKRRGNFKTKIKQKQKEAYKRPQKFKQTD